MQSHGQSIDPGAASLDCSLVIPVFNGEDTVEAVVDDIHAVFAGQRFEVVLVNDGSSDGSEARCTALARRHPRTVRFVQLARNFGEHNAVLAGLEHAAGAAVVVLDDDGQHPAGEARRLLDALREGGFDVVYGRYRTKQHSPMRNLGSRVVDRLYTVLLDKPPELYLSSFKAMNRFVVDHMRSCRTPYPHLDALIFRVTRHVGQIEVQHRLAPGGRSRYRVIQLATRWSAMVLHSSTVPLQLAAGVAAAGALASAFIYARLLVGSAAGVPVLPALVALLGVALLLGATMAIYLVALLADLFGAPTYAIRYVTPARSRDA